MSDLKSSGVQVEFVVRRCAQEDFVPHAVSLKEGQLGIKKTPENGESVFVFSWLGNLVSEGKVESLRSVHSGAGSHSAGIRSVDHWRTSISTTPLPAAEFRPEMESSLLGHPTTHYEISEDDNSWRRWEI